eukprot:3819751-Rhodomonas_salina.1
MPPTGHRPAGGVGFEWLTLPNGGILPILIGDGDQKLVGRAMMEAVGPNLAHYFLTAHQRAIQFAVGIEDG